MLLYYCRSPAADPGNVFGNLKLSLNFTMTGITVGLIKVLQQHKLFVAEC